MENKPAFKQMVGRQKTCKNEVVYSSIGIKTWKKGKYGERYSVDLEKKSS